MFPVSLFALCIACLIQVNYCAARRTYAVINGPAVYGSNLVYIPTITDQNCIYGSSYTLPVSYDSYSLSYPSVSCSCPSCVTSSSVSVTPSSVSVTPSSISATPSSVSVTPSSVSVTPSGTYGGKGSGKVSVTGTVDACGSTCVAGSVPVLGSACFNGCAPACGSVSIRGQCECGCY
ncbi:uncharacterized protein LOC134752717 [Cydia strobilella]|uniref:uncharacterized protein LOC134752717 n=1 Tax=Cydia strobilella TaxID=1100964 RepID=UPI00300672BD